jgi:hypothetical protein
MPLNLVLVAQRQSPDGMALTWSPLEGVASYQIFVAKKRLSPEELEAAQLLGGTEDCTVAKVGAEVSSVVDDITPQGEARHYGVAMVYDDGTVKAARFKAVPDGGQGDSFHLSMVHARMTTGSYRIKPAAEPAKAAPAPRVAAAPARAPAPAAPPAAAPASAEDPLEARKRAQREARAKAGGGDAVTEPPARAPAAAPTARSESASNEPPPSPASVPLQEPVDLRMQGGTQTWDGLRIYWEREPRAAAYEIIASDHQIFGEELADALAGKADFTTATAVAPSVSCVIDNTTPRDSRGWYAVLARYRDGRRAPHPFKVGDAATSGKASAPFLNPNRTGELRAEVEALLADAREQWERWKKEQDGGARREAKRMAGDALLMWPDHPAAKALLAEMS